MVFKFNFQRVGDRGIRLVDVWVGEEGRLADSGVLALDARKGEDALFRLLLRRAQVEAPDGPTVVIEEKGGKS